MASKQPGEIPAGETAKRMALDPTEIARRGWHVMLPGDTFNAMCQLCEKLLQDGAADAQGQQFIEGLLAAMVHQARPYAPRNKVQVAKTMPGLP